MSQQSVLTTTHKASAPPGYKKVWVDEFRGKHGSPVDSANWQVIDRYPNYNNELQAYSNSSQNIHLSGDGELNIIPRRVANPPNNSAAWTSARIECNHSWACEPGEKMLFEAEIKLGNNPEAEQLGIWPAFWALGKCIREGVSWPSCGEWDIMELVNGAGLNHGTLHFSYDASPTWDAGRDVAKFSRTVPFERGRWHTWGFRANRKPNPFQEETLTWYLDGKEFFRITGADVGTQEQWTQLAHRPFFPILNVAVGGDFPNGVAGFWTPTPATKDGHGSGMQVRYVAVYKSKD